MNHQEGVIAESEVLSEGGDISTQKGLWGPSMYALLVRESVQNSWDARDDSRGEASVRFSIDGFDLDSNEIDSLRSVMPVKNLKGFTRPKDGDEGSGALHPQAVLRRDSIKLLVISDRNTVGLCGPTRGGVKWDPVRFGEPMLRGQQRFANFVRNRGRSDSNTGNGDGGSFGIGKSALWMASECGTVLIHTRTTDEHGEPVDRFIGSIWGNDFSLPKSDDLYTGRHFIGAPSSVGRVDPLEGAAAASAVEGLPIPKYEVDGRAAFGTTLIIVAPRMHLAWQWEMDRLRDAIRWHVWPKRVPFGRGAGTPPDMDIRLSWNYNDVYVPEPLEDIEVRPYALALQHCGLSRNAEDSSDSKTLDYEAWCHKPSKRLGDLKFREGGAADNNVFHITQTTPESQEQDGISSGTDDELSDTDPVVDFIVPWGKIALVRREPLLLVKYVDIKGPDEAKRFVGVFLSDDDSDVEAALTKAEPPAHDDWSDRTVPKDHKSDHRKTYVRRTLAEISRINGDFSGQYRESDTGRMGQGEQLFSERLSNGLGGFGGPTVQPPTGEGIDPVPPPPLKPTASLDFIDTWAALGGAMHELNVTLGGLGELTTSVRIRANASGVDNAGSVPINGLVSFEWRLPDERVEHGDCIEVSAQDGFKCSLIIRVDGDFRIRPSVSVEKRETGA